MAFFFFWVAFSIAVGMFASVRRSRNGFGWFIIAIIISPLLAGTFAAILKDRPARKKDFFWPAVIIMVAAIAVLLVVIIGSHIEPTAHVANTSITRSTP